jgi:hypothetical protein
MSPGLCYLKQAYVSKTTGIHLTGIPKLFTHKSQITKGVTYVVCYPGHLVFTHKQHIKSYRVYIFLANIWVQNMKQSLRLEYHKLFTHKPQITSGMPYVICNPGHLIFTHKQQIICCMVYVIYSKHMGIRYAAILLTGRG